MVGLLNTSSCAPTNLEAGDSEEIAQVDALLLMSDLQWHGMIIENGMELLCTAGFIRQLTSWDCSIIHFLSFFMDFCIVFYIYVCIFDSYQILFVISSKRGSKA